MADDALLQDADSGTSLWQDAWHRLQKNKLAMASVVILVLVVLATVAGPWIIEATQGYTYRETRTALGVSAPSSAHWFGTDQLGRDLLTRTLHGGRISLLVGLVATGVSMLVGVAYGAIAGFSGGRTDQFMMRIVDVLYALPFTIFVIILMVVFGRNIYLLFLAIGAVEWLTMARIVRSQVISLREKEFIDATRVMGFRRRRIIFQHIIPNTLGPVIIYVTLTVPQVMLLEAFLSFLGLGVQAPMSSWGVLIKDGVGTMEEYPWMLLFPSLALSGTLFALNFLGDGLRDALDPKASKD
jgi:oligopeptide transport system permease protein